MDYVFHVYCPVCGARREIVSYLEEEHNLKLAMFLIDPSLKECYECWPSQEAIRYYKQFQEHFQCNLNFFIGDIFNAT
uniref:Uncharacterized protein n=1 Tax=viral metagenome TaxID=1070528 RepID=A0A6M3JHE1_9ZZZZ